MFVGRTCGSFAIVVLDSRISRVFGRSPGGGARRRGGGSGGDAAGRPSSGPSATSPQGASFSYAPCKQPLQSGSIDVGHKPGNEWRVRKEMHMRLGSTRKQVVETENDPSLYHLEDASSNRSHVHEGK